jgi:protein TonB
VGQTGRESFVLLVDEQGRPAVVGFTHLLQYGLEETTMEAVKNWKFEPAMKDGKPVAIRIPASIDYKASDKK